MLGLTLTVLTGVMWALVGVTISAAARRGIHPVSFAFASGLIILPVVLASCLVLGDWSSFSADDWQAMRPGPSLLIITAQVVAGLVGIWMLQVAMKRGPNALAWGVGQSAIIFPFFISVFLWSEQVTVIRVIGLIGVFGCIALSTLSKRSAANRNVVEQAWMVLAIGALIALGAQQSLSLVLSHYESWRTTEGVLLRLGVAQVIGVGITFVACAAFGWMPGRREFQLGAAHALVVLLGKVLFLLASDQMAMLNLSSVVYPVAVGVCIAGFGLFCWLWLRERLPVHQVLGLLAGAGGVVLLAWG